MTKYIIKNQFDRYIYKKEHVEAIIKMVEYDMHEILLDGCKIIKGLVRDTKQGDDTFIIVIVTIEGLENV